KTADGEPLSTIIQADPERVLGEVYSLNNRKLPFLFKVLSVRIPLSIQLHPNKQQAAELHIRDGINYPDSNHKPELAYALSEVSLLHGFRTYPEIHENVTSIAELSELIPDSIVIEA